MDLYYDLYKSFYRSVLPSTSSSPSQEHWHIFSVFLISNLHSWVPFKLLNLKEIFKSIVHHLQCQIAFWIPLGTLSLSYVSSTTALHRREQLLKRSAMKSFLFTNWSVFMRVHFSKIPHPALIFGTLSCLRVLCPRFWTSLIVCHRNLRGELQAPLPFPFSSLPSAQMPLAPLFQLPNLLLNIHTVSNATWDITVSVH